MRRVAHLLFFTITALAQMSHAAEASKSDSARESLVDKIQTEKTLSDLLPLVKSVEELLLANMRKDQAELKGIPDSEFTYKNPSVARALESAEVYFIFKPILDYHLHSRPEEKISAEGCKTIENELLYNYSFGRQEGAKITGDTAIALKIHQKICKLIK